MKTSSYKIHLIYLSIIVLITLLWVNHTKSLQRQLENEITASSYLTVKLDSFRNKNGELVYQQEILSTSSKKTIKELTDSLHLSKKVIGKPEYVSHTTTEAKITDKLAEYHDTSTVKEKEDSCVKVGRIFKLQEKWWDIEGKVLLEGIKIDTLIIRDEVYVVITQQRTGFLGLKRKKSIIIQHKNPYICVTNSQVLELKDPPSKFKWVIPLSSAIISGILTYKVMK